jgi:2'-5' RNA ligase
MKPSQIKISNPVEELFFVIAPPRHIKSDVSVLKDDVQYLIGHQFDDRYSVAHISLFKFDDQDRFADIVNHVEYAAKGFSPFNIFIKNMIAFHHGSFCTICLDIVNKYHVREIFEKTVKQDAQYVPTITIARKLDVEDFLRAWPYLKDFKYSQHFLCDRITVLGKKDNRWIHFKDIMFGE